MSKLNAQDLAQFTGTTCYYLIGRQHLLTDGTHYLAEKAGCYWIIDAATSHLKEIDTSDWFFAVRMNVTHQRAMMRYLDGNGRELVSQKNRHTDFPLSTTWNSEYWVIMLHSEY